MRIVRARRKAAQRAELRRYGAIVGGAVALVASTTIPLVRRFNRRHTDNALAPTATGSASEPQGHVLGGSTDPLDQVSTATVGTTPKTGPGDSSHAVAEQQSTYGLGYDQHSTHDRGRPIAWIVVAIIIAGTCIGGASLIAAAPWLFWTGVGVVFVGVVLGRVTHAMRDETPPFPGPTLARPSGHPMASRDSR
jgi:hypothetical protein